MRSSSSRPVARWRRWLAWSAALLLLALVFASYLQPGFVVAVATRVWACF